MGTYNLEAGGFNKVSEISEISEVNNEISLESFNADTESLVKAFNNIIKRPKRLPK